MPQRILYCTDSLMAGGTEQQLIELISGLDRQRFEPHVVCLYSDRANRSLHFLAHLQKLDVPVVILDLDWGQWDKLRAIIALARIIWHVRPHLVQAVNYHSNLLVRLARLLLPLSTKLVGCVYVDYTLKQIFYEYMTGWLCNATVCNTIHIQKQLPQYLSLQMISNGIDVERFSHNPDPSLRKRLSPKAKFIVLILGRIARQKSPHLLVEALGILKQRSQPLSEIVVWIVGEAQEREAQHQINAAIRHYGLENFVLQFPATVSPEAYYHAADLVVLPSLWEGLPNVILEALAAGKPLIVSEAANSAGIIRHGENGWVVKTGDTHSLAATLCEVLTLDLSRLGAYCQESAVHFSLVNMVREYEALYARLSVRS